ncbi:MULTISPECIES: primosomal protein N' [unclassified Achromobacter]|uniref:primosomal protein N' n=1 Tax=unclassified Achromobacter TaxID=2626865 RepID=UPI000B514BBB|nr:MULTISPECIES: primosomal protein N' [unclassified Achromobacter]OWT75709.1 primosomal protein N' [Achromobacter sp. HZ28]OWT76370.1 primosomal protein N' [Achromobacter sp. HZ34]
MGAPDAPEAPGVAGASGAAGVAWVRVALDVPLPGPFDYRAQAPLAAGLRVIVPFGRRRMIGVVVDNPAEPSFDPAQVKAIERVLDDLPPFGADWLRLAAFAADYYQRPLGEVMLPALPPPLRKVSAYEGQRSATGPVARMDQRAAPNPSKKKRTSKALQATTASPAAPMALAGAPVAAVAPVLNPDQQAAVDAIAAVQGFKPVLLHGVTGSGKTEVYLHAAERVLAAGRQVLLMVPEINLTPQLEAVLRARLDTVAGPGALAVLHSGLADGERLQAWARAQRGQARVLLGTRMSVFAALPDLGLIIVDEEHDASYKQQDGLRYSARDLAIWRAHDLDIPVLLGSATPSLESWLHAERGRYLRLTLAGRAKSSSLPAIRLVDTRRLAMKQGLSPQLTDAIGKRLERGEQSLVFLNRRGYAPVLHCSSCAWVSNCPRCSAYTVLHRGPGAGGHLLACHHCGFQARVPRACPECGDQDLQPMGRGTQRVEEHLGELFPGARILRIDADSTRRKGSAQALFASVHAGEVDILVGTQMVAKGHDFSRLGLVGVINADSMLFAHDFRAPERLFAQLMQVAGRAGRHTEGGEVLIQTGYPEQPVYQALLRHDYAGFARHALRERESTGLPPYAYQALLTAEARELAQALAFLQEARALPESTGAFGTLASTITRYDPVPLRVVRVANVERAQLLVESGHRPALQAFLSTWSAMLPQVASAHRVRWQLEVDPLEI